MSSPQGISKSPTGIDGFDDLTLGGVPTGRPTLVCGSAGCGKTLFATTFLIHGARDFDEPGVFVTFEERPGDIVSNVASLGFALNKLVDDQKIAFEYIALDRSELEEAGDYDLEGLFLRLEAAIDSVGAKRVVLDTIESLFSVFSNRGDPARRNPPVVRLAERQGNDDGHYRGAWRWHAHAAGAGRIRLGLRDLA